MSFSKLSMSISKKVEKAGKNEYEEIGKVTAFVPMPDEFGIQASVKQENGQPVVDDEGLPVYDDDKLNWLVSAISQYVKMTARNKLVPGTVELRDGAKIPENWEQLLAEGGNRGEALKLIAEIKKAFSSYVTGLDKKPEVKQTIIALFANKQGLALQTQGTKDKFINYLTSFAETLEPATLERYGKYLQSLEETCKTAAVDLD